MHKHKEKPLKALVRHILELDIHHPERVIATNRQINHIAYKESRHLSDNRDYKKLIDLTDEIAILSESAVQSPAIAMIRISPQFEDKKKELQDLYQQMFCSKPQKKD